jgi:hypothetical protein
VREGGRERKGEQHNFDWTTNNGTRESAYYEELRMPPVSV